MSSQKQRRHTSSGFQITLKSVWTVHVGYKIINKWLQRYAAKASQSVICKKNNSEHIITKKRFSTAERADWFPAQWMRLCWLHWGLGKNRKKHESLYMSSFLQRVLRVAVCCPSLAVYVEMDNVHEVGAWSSPTSSVVLPKETALRFQLLQPRKQQQTNSEQKNFSLW